MPAYTIIYSNQDNEKLLKETVFMKNLGAAKRSALANAPVITQHIAIYDLMEKCLTQKLNDGPWLQPEYA
ncbi:hypothetical protein ACIMS1_004400 [Vibrio harveyi]